MRSHLRQGRFAHTVAMMLSLIFVLSSSLSWADALATEMVELSDAELDEVTAGTIDVDRSEDVVRFAATKATASGKTVAVDGTFELVDVLNSQTIGSLILRDGAQGNLNSLININAVNSQVNVLLNLNVNINSEVGVVDQRNLNGLLPNIPAFQP